MYGQRYIQKIFYGEKYFNASAYTGLDGLS